jgi:hypothetical protein
VASTINRILKYECRCKERLKGKVEGSIRLVYTVLSGGLSRTPKDRDEVTER